MLPFLRGLFGPGVLEPIRLHVEAKRYLCYLEPHYEASLRRTRSAAWRCRGSFDAGQALDFASLPGAPDAIRLRRWDDMAKVPGLITPSLEHYLEIAESVSTRAKLAAIH